MLSLGYAVEIPSRAKIALWPHMLFIFAPDITDVLRNKSQVCENAARYGADASKGCLVAGASAGAALGLQVAYDFIAKGNHSPVTGLVLLFPFAAHSTYDGKYKELHTSRQENAEGVPIMNLMAFERILGT
jgi:acetyl esterase/lipase